MERSSPARDRYFMKNALNISLRGIGNTWPNPSVGAVVGRCDTILYNICFPYRRLNFVFPINYRIIKIIISFFLKTIYCCHDVKDISLYVACNFIIFLHYFL